MNTPNKTLQQHLSEAQEHAKEHPSPAVAGAVNVLPLLEDGTAVLQFNGFAIRLLPGKFCETFGTWILVDTAAQAQADTQSKE
jgi:hypothetical protein